MKEHIAASHFPAVARTAPPISLTARGTDVKKDIRTILLVEDSSADAELTLDALRDAHLANPVVHVEDGAEALDYLLRRGEFSSRADDDPVVVLLDIKMPRVDGLEVLRTMRQTAALKRLPVDLGVNAYVVKPVDVRQFFEAVQTLGQFWAVLNEAPEEQ